MARRKKLREEQENHERWLVSYADFITLLFAFFVVMYSISSINEGKYRILAEALTQAFSESPKKLAEPQRTLEPIQIGEVVRRIEPIKAGIMGDAIAQPTEENAAWLEALAHEQAQLKAISERLKEALSPYIDEDLIAVTREQLWIEVEMKSSLLFGSARAEPSEKALPVLKKIGGILRQIPNSVHVEGHTDNLPISTIEFPSNWELSAARAASIVHHLMQYGISPERMAAIGYGEYHPVADNRTEEGRYNNRRVVLVLLSQAAARYALGSNERAGLMTSSAKSPGEEAVR